MNFNEWVFVRTHYYYPTTTNNSTPYLYKHHAPFFPYSTKTFSPFVTYFENSKRKAITSSFPHVL
ncbi:hypothetical protein CW304_09545 [Bacillus sp. UFRGS-B20]|nr:hypothetical protein CW304_09545 [Bacillus sp. UFRGS-B20]